MSSNFDPSQFPGGDLLMGLAIKAVNRTPVEKAITSIVQIAGLTLFIVGVVALQGNIPSIGYGGAVTMTTIGAILSIPIFIGGAVLGCMITCSPCLSSCSSLAMNH